MDELLLQKFSSNLYLVSWPIHESNDIAPHGVVAFSDKMDDSLVVIAGNVTLVNFEYPYLTGKKERFKSPFSNDSAFSKDWQTSGFFLIDIRQFQDFGWRGLDNPKIEWFSKEGDMKHELLQKQRK